MFLNTLYATTSNGGNIGDAWKKKIREILREFVGRYTTLPVNAEVTDIASKSLMHSSILMCENMAYHYYCDPFYFNIVAHEMISEATGLKRMLLRQVVFVMQRCNSGWPCNFTYSEWVGITDSEWESIASTRIALAMGSHPRLGADSPLSALDSGLLPCIALHWQRVRFSARGIDDFDEFVNQWNIRYADEDMGLLILLGL
jgi:hypothetical protein